jgi:hypothetical protein
MISQLRREAFTSPAATVDATGSPPLARSSVSAIESLLPACDNVIIKAQKK